MALNQALMSSASRALRDERIVLRLRALLGVVVGPGELLEFERAALPDAGAIGAGEASGIDHHAGEARRIETGQRRLRMRRIGKAHGADLPVAPGLLDDPGAGVETVRPLGQILGEYRLQNRSGRGNPDRSPRSRRARNAIATSAARHGLAHARARSRSASARVLP